LIEREFKLKDFKVLDDFEVKSVGVEREERSRKVRRTLFDFVE
jgi:hypothetical protein